MRHDRPTRRRREVLRPGGAPKGDRPTPTEAWLGELGLEVHEVARCPVAGCEVCDGALRRAA
ncbi:MAG: hypothetical protein R3290_11485 [Acidimicrobiia bacterium]|nr:hypothetical protein [Acidimicrobiia bacterium]